MGADRVSFDFVLLSLQEEIPAEDVFLIDQLKSHCSQLDENDVRHDLYISYLYALAHKNAVAKASCERYVVDHWITFIEYPELLNTLAEITFRIRDFQLLGNFINHAYGVKTSIFFGSHGNVPQVSGIAIWSLQVDGDMSFLFNETIYSHLYRNVLLKHWIQCLPLYCEFRKIYPTKTGFVVINLEDFGSVPGLAFCDFRPEFSLVPDPIFLQKRAYAQEKELYGFAPIAWENRKPIALWRGVTTGFFDCNGQRIQRWQDLPRIQLCFVSQKNKRLIDAGITEIVQLEEKNLEETFRRLDLHRNHMNISHFHEYKFHIDIDGNSSSWPGLFTKLCSGSVVLKVTSPCGFRQWYYDRLIPWHNFIPIKKDLSDLIEILEWLNQHDKVAQTIANNGKFLAESMTLDGEIARAMPIIADAFGLSEKREAGG
jgi:hypothetical protein